MTEQTTAIAVATSIDILMVLAIYLPMATGALFVLPISSMGAGAYVGAEMAIHGQSGWLCLVAGGVSGMLVAAVGGCLTVRMPAWSGAIATMAMVSILQVAAQNFDAIGAANGLPGVPLYTDAHLTYAVTAVIVLAVVALELGKLGDILEAIRSDELAAECSGIRVVSTRLVLFSVSGTIAGMAGVMSVGYLGYVDPANYGFAQLTGYVMAAIFGGSTTAVGSVLGGATINVLPQVLSVLAHYTLVAFSGAVIAVILWRSDGLVTRRYVKRGVSFLGRRLRLSREHDERVSKGNHSSTPSRRPGQMKLQAVGLSKSYHGVSAVNEVELTAMTGSVLGIIGANGAGKTSLVNLLSGITRRDKGEMHITRGDVRTKIGRLTPERAVKLGLARTFQNLRLFVGLTVREHLSLIRGADAAALLELMQLAARAEDVASSLPYGEQRLVEIARALGTSPSILILDEPTAGMTREESAKVAELVCVLKTQGLGFIIVDHNVEFIRSVSDQMIAMDFGKVIARGTPDEVLRSDAVVYAYLGAPEGEPGRGHALATRAVAQDVEIAGIDARPPALEVHDLVVAYGNIVAVRGVSLDLGPGQVKAVVGANGAGKTSLLRAICGQVSVRSGTVEVEGADVTAASTRNRARRGLTQVPEGRGVFPGMSVEDNLLTAVGSASLQDGISKCYDTFPLLRPLRGRRAGQLSGGEQQVLALARALLTNPRVLLLDEPSMGLAPIAVGRVLDALSGLGADGPAILLVEQNPQIAIRLSPYIYVMQHGRIAFEGAAADVAKSDTMRRLYFGG